ncbi:transglutaminase-like cysteine peptidase [Agrobacterium tumefaciens]|uniref:transglutaminase-like cysteine peptidase n=1 Tax=Agrobacterium tumefaciens complex TaxID=1183400 RepID=UPI000DD2D5E6|nr:transglutaminase-like cysteine peptidase [Agrobacterium tumefaciens]QNP82571.1 transglutaminase-like cysteine peptidase [Agrobacterium tumefaciens]UXS12122.1 transglutaminase-like cysteine peptidase [Agrobacterium tumefaciens]UXS19490.1 transglutaminase-like cysteine peptidase [Agrobacterium tumefaciens]UXT68187.1 transglutaminase-like cysteine peptidase [Agrobacterium tumefaciens]
MTLPIKLLQACFILIATCLAAPVQASPFMQTGRITSQPVGHYDFCQRHSVECQPVTATPPLTLTPDAWATIVSVNNAVNVEIDQRTDMEVWGYEDYWEYPYKGAGDCEDLALEKRRRLLQSGFAVSNLLITVVRDERGEGHAILTVRTDRGDFILDNMKAKVLRWDETAYTYLKRQSTDHAGRWVDIEGPAAPAIASREAGRATATSATARRSLFDIFKSR